MNRDLELRLDITNHCNLRCIMCHMSYQVRTPWCMSLDLFKEKISGVLPRTSVLFLSWGTEPLLNPELPDILQYIRPFKIPYVLLCTNLTLLTNKIAEAFAGGGLHCIHVSLDASDRDLLARIRRGADFDKITANVRKLQEIKKSRKSPYPWIVFNYVLMKMNLEHLHDFIDYAHGLDIREINCSEMDFVHDYQSPQTTGAGDIDLTEQKIDCSSTDVRNVLHRMDTYAAGKGIFLNYPGKLDRSRYAKIAFAGVMLKYAWQKGRFITWPAKISIIINYLKNRLLLRSVICSSPWRQMVVSPDGYVVPCCMWADEYRLGDIHTESLEKIWKSRKFEALREGMQSGKPHKICRDCKINTVKRHGI